MPSKPAADAHPENPPEFNRRVVFCGRRLPGLILLFAIPVLALFRLLGDGQETLTASRGDLVLKVDAPVCARYGNSLQLKVSVSTPGAAVVKSRRVSVDLSSEYLGRFSDVHAHHAPVRLTDAASRYEVELSVSGGVAALIIDLTPERYGWARGTVSATLESGESVELALKTFIFP